MSTVTEAKPHCAMHSAEETGGNGEPAVHDRLARRPDFLDLVRHRIRFPSIRARHARRGAKQGQFGQGRAPFSHPWCLRVGRWSVSQPGSFYDAACSQLGSCVRADAGAGASRGVLRVDFPGDRMARSMSVLVRRATGLPGRAHPWRRAGYVRRVRATLGGAGKPLCAALSAGDGDRDPAPRCHAFRRYWPDDYDARLHASSRRQQAACSYPGAGLTRSLCRSATRSGGGARRSVHVAVQKTADRWHRFG